MAKRPTQKDRILDHIKRYGSITPMDAYYFLGITKLATRVSEMRREGIEFNIIIEHGINQVGVPMHYARYSLKGSDKNGN